MLQIVVDVHMPLLFVRDSDSRVGSGAYQGPNSCHGVVHISNSLLNSYFHSQTNYLFLLSTLGHF